MTQDNNLQPFDFEGNEVRVMRDGNGNPLFCAKDVAIILGYTNPNKAIRDHTRGERIVHTLQTAGGMQEMQFITEGDMYRLVTSSKLPAAERFERWVYDEVLPSIRRHGGYMAGQERMTPEQMALASLKWLQSKVDEQARQLKAQEGKVLFANAVESAKTSILVGDLAKILKGNGVDIGQKTPVRMASQPRVAHQGERRELEHADPEGHGPRPVRNQGDDRHPRRRTHHDQQDTESDRQRADVFCRPVPPPADLGSRCVMNDIRHRCVKALLDDIRKQGAAIRVPGDLEIKSDAERVVVSDAIIDLAEIVDIVIDTINQEL